MSPKYVLTLLALALSVIALIVPTGYPVLTVAVVLLALAALL